LSETRFQIEELYCEIKSKLFSSVGNRGRKHSISDTLNSSKLPIIKLTEFSGRFPEWTSWFNTFKTLLGTDPELDDLKKIIHLRAPLGPAPLSKIDGLELSEVNYKKALLLLQERYDNKAIILQAHLTELFNVKRIKQADSDSLRALVDSVNSQLVALRSLSEESELLNVFRKTNLRQIR